MDIRIITSVAEIKATLKVGDQFWSISYHSGRGPVGIEGPMTITRFGEGDEKMLVFVTTPELNFEHSQHMSDLVNEYHIGVLLTEADARAFLAQEQQRYADDPALQTRLAEERAEFEREEREDEETSRQMDEERLGGSF